MNLLSLRGVSKPKTKLDKKIDMNTILFSVEAHFHLLRQQAVIDFSII